MHWTYSEATTLFSTAYPNIFSIENLTELEKQAVFLTFPTLACTNSSNYERTI